MLRPIRINQGKVTISRQGRLARFCALSVFLYMVVVLTYLIQWVNFPIDTIQMTPICDKAVLSCGAVYYVVQDDID